MMRPRAPSILAMAASSIALAGCSLVLDAAGPYDSADADGGGAHGGFCAALRPTPPLCSDFDDNAPFNEGWSSVFLAGGGMLTTQSGVSFSAPSSLKATTPSFTPGSSFPTAGMFYGLAGKAGTVHLESQIRIDAIGADQCFVALAITQKAAGGPYLQAQLFLCSGTAFAQEQDGACACTTDFGLSATFALGTWHRFAIEVTFGATPSMAFWVDGVDGVDGGSPPALGPVALTYPWQSSPYGVQAGIGYIGGGAGEPIQVDLDDIAAWLK